MSNFKTVRLPVQFIKKSLLFKKFEQLNLKNKLLLSFLFVSIIPILFVQVLSYYNSTVSMKKKLEELIRFNLSQTAKNMETNIESYDNLLIQIFVDDSILDLAKKLNRGSETERLLAANDLRAKFGIITNSMPGVKCISILTASGQVAWYDRDNNSGIRNIWSKYPNVTHTEVFLRAQNSYQRILTLPYSDEYLGKKYYFINFTLKLYDWKNVNSACIGVVVLSVDENYLYSSCNRPFGLKNNAANFNFIVDKNGTIISFPDKQFINQTIGLPTAVSSPGRMNRALAEFIRKNGGIKPRQLILNKIPLDQTGWWVVNAADQNYLFQEMYWMQQINIIFGVLAILFSVMIIIYVTKTLSQSIAKIVKAMNTAQTGELSVQVNLDTKDEIAIIGSNFNKMMIRLQQLMEEVKTATGRQKEAEIKALVAQINPHFLYNMLDSINWMAIEKEEHEISQMIENLANILRYTINDSNWVVTLREEVSWLKQYIYLQQNHCEYAFESIIDFDEPILDIKIYKLLLQPLVENAIIHGFKEYASGGILKIKGNMAGDFIKITIADNGKGMSPEILGSISREIQEQRSYSGVGIKNVINRLRIYYGEAAELNYTSQPGMGTTVTLLIPRM
ncbi:MAG TPA: sensor histidine kinase [Bacillota bacterium]|nr:sensor histidine kinase [Bacillota bacterium]